METVNASKCYQKAIESIKRFSNSNLKIYPCPLVKQVMIDRARYFDLVQKCPRPCEVMEYQGITKEYIGWGTDRSLIFFTYFLSNELNVEEEYLVYNEADLVGIVGGNLGLFIGFSFHDVLGKIVNFFI